MLSPSSASAVRSFSQATPPPRSFWKSVCCAFGLFVLGLPAWSDVPLPARVLDPQSAPEAWNVIRLASTNVGRLIEENRLSEISAQISLCSPAIRALSKYAPPTSGQAPLAALNARSLDAVNSIVVASKAGDRNAVEHNFGIFQSSLK